jgi:hypothetical protein
MDRYARKKAKLRSGFWTAVQIPLVIGEFLSPSKVVSNKLDSLGWKVQEKIDKADDDVSSTIKYGAKGFEADDEG